MRRAEAEPDVKIAARVERCDRCGQEFAAAEHRVVERRQVVEILRSSPPSLRPRSTRFGVLRAGDEGRGVWAGDQGEELGQLGATNGNGVRRAGRGHPLGGDSEYGSVVRMR